MSIPRESAWAGLVGGVISWYGAHEIGIFFSDYNCRHHWILPAAHVLAAAACGFFGLLSLRAWRASRGRAAEERDAFGALVSTLAAAVFAIVILWQAVAAFIYSGCER